MKVHLLCPFKRLHMNGDVTCARLLLALECSNELQPVLCVTYVSTTPTSLHRVEDVCTPAP